MFKLHALVEKLFLSDPKECMAVFLGAVLKEVTTEQRTASEADIEKYIQIQVAHFRKKNQDRHF